MFRSQRQEEQGRNQRKLSCNNVQISRDWLRHSLKPFCPADQDFATFSLGNLKFQIRLVHGKEKEAWLLRATRVRIEKSLLHRQLSQNCLSPARASTSRGATSSTCRKLHDFVLILLLGVLSPHERLSTRILRINVCPLHDLFALRSPLQVLLLSFRDQINNLTSESNELEPWKTY